MKVEQSLNVAFNESPPPTKLSLLVDDDVGEEEAIRKNTKIVNTNNEEDESIEVDEIINIKESKNHPLDRVIGNLNQRTLRSQAQNHKPGRGSSVPIDLFTAFALTQPLILPFFSSMAWLDHTFEVALSLNGELKKYVCMRVYIGSKPWSGVQVKWSGGQDVVE
ncbi:hypothetical protein Tco_0737745 [Tanacetum coccineum]